MSQLSFLAIAQGKKVLRCEKFLSEMNRVLPWDRLYRLIEPYYQEAEVGRKRKELGLMLKIHCLQQWYSLSDPAVEEAIYDRNSFQKFLGLDLLTEAVPDETTILNFRHLLEAHDLAKAMLKEINRYLEGRGLMMKNGTIVDATLIAAAKSTKNQGGKRDPEMSSTKKNNTWYFGMKAHVGVDSKSGLVRDVEATTAKVHDREMLENLLGEEEKAIYGDKGYFDDKMKKKCRKDGVFWGILDRARRNRPLSNSQHKRNRKLSSIRSKVEQPFQVIKCLWGYTKVRYRGIKKNAGQLFMLFGLSNLFRVRRVLLAT
jgi:IS5 family transposase